MSRWSGVALAITTAVMLTLAPLEASAWGGHGWGGHGWGGHGWHGWRFGRFGQFGRFGRYPAAAAYGYSGFSGYYDAPDYSLGCVWARQLIQTPDGPHYRYFPVCDGY
jgi:hypothetical protein